ncbi:M42 family metallopeptidase [Paenibacillus sp.]|uniref:M42 family metallopeptidase n=1 Tax=Paenibacillus sp. TaxID=58172 RepID=UPI0039C92A5F
MTDARMALCRELTELPGASGFEHAVRDAVRRHLEPLVDTIEADRLGSLIGRKVGHAEGPRVMLAAHLDELGFLVTQVTEEGFLRIQPLGGWWEQAMLAQRVTVHTRSGVLSGVIGSKPTHIIPAEERKRTVPMNEMFVDIGVSGKSEAVAAGVRPGDAVLPVCPFTVMQNPNYWMAKAWDNRFGCVVAIEVLRRLRDVPHPNVVYAVGTVQEEIGMRGAETSANAVRPDIAIALDVGVAGDTPNIRSGEAAARLGGGPTLCLLDRSMLPHKEFRDLVIDTAEEENIPLQFETMPGGATDAGRLHLHGTGVPSIFLGAAARYIHSAASVLHRDDLEATIRLVTAVVRKLDRSTVETLTRY